MGEGGLFLYFCHFSWFLVLYTKIAISVLNSANQSVSSCFHIVHLFANSFLPYLMLPTQDHIMAAQLIWGAAFKKVPRGRKVCLSQFAFYLCILIFPILNLLTISPQVMIMSKDNELQNDISS